MVEGLVSNSGNSLILQNTREKILTKIENGRPLETARKEQERWEEIKKGFARSFICEYCGIFKTEKSILKDFNNEELLELANIVFEKLKFSDKCEELLMKMLLFFSCSIVPVLGWWVLYQLLIKKQEYPINLYSHKYLFLKDKFGDNWFPYEILKEELEK